MLGAQPYDEINWEAQRNNCGTEDMYVQHSFLQVREITQRTSLLQNSIEKPRLLYARGSGLARSLARARGCRLSAAPPPLRVAGGAVEVRLGGGALDSAGAQEQRCPRLLSSPCPQ